MTSLCYAASAAKIIIRKDVRQTLVNLGAQNLQIRPCLIILGGKCNYSLVRSHVCRLSNGSPIGTDLLSRSNYISTMFAMQLLAHAAIDAKIRR